ncbi:hypothetical protein [Nostoc sp. PCC 7107]|uniref:hypothetical protein n=1 Tax=Nostoc sp. PCC 7107 TaxID=317936 RepID=UPI00029EEB24|nr:hypothetical protein [Nostoc sp. PCC 7107]AFY44273.1 WD-40 repeat-containing protein [Nostoc sp. PCC 7107]
MAVNRINTKISTQVLNFQPGGSPASFDVTVVNESNQFASLQIEIIAAGGGESLGSNWYKITPSVSAKNPPGDSTKFEVTITNTPVAGFIGKMNLIVRIFSLELGDEDRQILRLIVEAGVGAVAMQVELITREFTPQPQGLIEIPVRVFNPSQIPASVSLKPIGLQPQWFINGDERLLEVSPGAKKETSFLCQLPSLEAVPSQAYPFTIEATYSHGVPSRSREGIINVNPAGSIDFRCTLEKQQIPASRPWLPQLRVNSTTYQLECQNHSNLSKKVSIEVKEGEEGQPKSFWQVEPEFVELHPGENNNLQLLVSKRRQWFGLKQKLSYKVKVIVPDQRVNVKYINQDLQLIIHPILHPWLQMSVGVLLLFLLWFLSWLNPNNPFFGHRRSVTFVQFNGVGDHAVSSSQDQSIIRWKIAGFTNPFVNQDDGRMAKNIGKSVRVVRYKPVDNDVVAAGLENGEIQIWDVLGGTKKPKVTFSNDKADRVLGLEFSQDSHYLFSGHGSGLVLQWDVDSALLDDHQSLTKNDSCKDVKFLVDCKDVNFPIYSLTLAGNDKQNLVIGGRYNNLAIWNFSQNKLWKVPYNPPGSQNDYIVSVDSTEYKPSLLATADNMGQITLWNMQQCLSKNNGQCQVIDKWSDGHGGKAVRSVALSRDGCYLASGGDDNRVMLWPLTQAGRRISPVGQVIRKEKQRFNSIDVKVVKNKILIISGNDDHKVRLDIRDLNKNVGCKQ